MTRIVHDHLYRIDWSNVKTTDPPHGPRMYSCPPIRLGRPVSEYDLEFVRKVTDYGIDPHERIVPKNRDFNLTMNSFVSTKSMVRHFEVRTVTQLHEEFLLMMKGWKGRPSTFLQHECAQLVEWRDALWQGDLTAIELSRIVGCSEPAALRFKHAETLWWI